MMKLTVNGRELETDASPETPLLWVLRDHLGLTGTKFGCGMALCGACTVHLEGAPIRSGEPSVVRWRLLASLARVIAVEKPMQ